MQKNVPNENISSVLSKKIFSLKHELEQKILGQEETIEFCLIALLSGGHVLLEGPPGVGKTALANGVAKLFQGIFHRIQLTSDLLPSDILGTLRLKPGASDFEFRKGPIFAQVLLADELNRTSARTQAALLEAMSEEKVTIDGTSYDLPQPFFVIATQNPQEFQGVYPLSESQLDRFMFHLLMKMPDATQEIRAYQEYSNNLSGNEMLLHSLTPAQLLEIKKEVKKIFIEESILQYLQKVAAEIRKNPDVTHGASMRSMLQIIDAAKAKAYLKDRDFVIPQDVQLLLPMALAHRLCLHSEYSAQQRREIIYESMDRITAPK